jgi:microcystin-dependent protein
MSVSNSLGYEGYPTSVATILPYMGQDANILPSGWLFCDGRELFKQHYPELYAVIGNNYNLSTTTAGNFCIPDLRTNDNYLYPSDETEPGGDGGVSPAKVVIDPANPLTLTASEIPSLTAGNISTTYATNQVGFAGGLTYNVRGNYPASQYDTTTGANTPEIVKLNSTTEDSGNFTLTSADYGFKNTNQKAITDIKTDSTHGIQYGGMSCCYIIKVSSLLYDPDGTLRKNIDDVVVEARDAAFQRQLQAEAYATQTEERDQEADDKAENQSQALDANGQGGGTAVPFADVPMLSGFVIPANPEY